MAGGVSKYMGHFNQYALNSMGGSKLNTLRVSDIDMQSYPGHK